MDSPRKVWLINISFDAVVFSLLAYGSLAGSDGALLAFQVWVWTFSILGILVGFTCDKTTFAKHPRPPGFVCWHFGTEAILISWTAWAGMPMLATTRIISNLCIEAARIREPSAA